MASAEIYDEEVQKAREDVKALRVQMRILKAKLASAKNYLVSS